MRPLVALLVVLGVVASGLPPVAPQPANASHGNIKMPFAAGVDWYISQGYNTSPAEGWSHYNCDPRTGRDEISGTESCGAGWQYKYSFDLRRSDGQEAGQAVLSPVDGVIRWIDPFHGGMSIDLGDGYAVAFYHADLAGGVAEGQTVRQGQRLGTVAGPGGGANGGTPHIHLTLWRTEDGGNWSRNAVPFTDQHVLDGYDFPALGDRVRNQHFNAVVASTNQGGAEEPPASAEPEIPGAELPPASSPRDGRDGTNGSDGTTPDAAPNRRGRGGPAPTPTETPTTPPTTPKPAAPVSGTLFTADQSPILSWEPVPGALEYQVVLNDGERTGPWLPETSWAVGSLPAGEYRWQVRARNWAGESALWEPWTFTVAAPPVDASGAVAATPPADPVAGDAAATTPAAELASPSPVVPATDAATPGPTATPTATTSPDVPVAETTTSVIPTAPTNAADPADPTSLPTTAGTAAPEDAPADGEGGGDTTGDGGRDDRGTLSPREQGIAAGAVDKANELRERQGLGPMEFPGAIDPGAGAGTEPDRGARREPVVEAAQDAPLAGEGVDPNRRDGVGGPRGDLPPTEPAPVDPAPTDSAPMVAPDAGDVPPVVDDQGGEDGVARSSNEPGTKRQRPRRTDAAPAPDAPPAIEATAPAGPAPAETANPGTPDSETTDTETADDAETASDAPGEDALGPAPSDADEPTADGTVDAAPPMGGPTDTAAPIAAADGSDESASEPPAPASEVVVAPAPAPASEPTATAAPSPADGPTWEVEAPASERDAPAPASGVDAVPVVEPAADAIGTDEPAADSIMPDEPTPDAVTAVESSADLVATVEPAADAAALAPPMPEPAPEIDPALVVEPAGAADPMLPGEPGATDAPPSTDPVAVPAVDTAAAAPAQALTFVPVADTSVMTVAPDAAQVPEQVGMLATGGPVGAVAYVTFEVVGVPAGTVLDARLILTGVGDVAGPGGVLGVLPGVWVDEGATFAALPPPGAPALTGAGTVATVDWLQPGVETVVDVSGSATADGLITFVLVGSPEAMAAVASREGATPPRLVLAVAVATATSDHFSG